MTSWFFRHIGQLLKSFSALFVGVWLLFAPVQADVRILIDVSSSVAQSDPERDRIRRIETLIDQLPSGEPAGIWTFGQFVNLLMPHEPVNTAWRARAKQRLSVLTNPATRTNMGRALEEAAYDFDFDRFGGDIDVVLVSDGNVDIAPNNEVNQVERERLISQVAERFRTANARIHTLSVSQTGADSLLKTLSERTGGQYQNASQGSIRLASSVPSNPTRSNEISNNVQLGFTVREGTRELMVALAHTDGLAKLTAPSGSVTSALMPMGQQWVLNTGRTQVSIRNPAVGRWTFSNVKGVKGEVSVLADPTLVWAAPTQSRLSQTGMVDVVAELVDRQGNTVMMNLSGLLNAQLAVNGRAVPTEIDGHQIKAQLRPSVMGNRAALALTVDADTFKQTIRRELTLISPYLEEVLATERGYEWRLYTHRLLDEMPDLQANAIVDVNGEQMQQVFELQDEGYWLWLLPANAAAGSYDVVLEGTLTQGENITLLTGMQSFVLPMGPIALLENNGMGQPEPMMADAPMMLPAPEMNPSMLPFIKDPMPLFEEIQVDLVVEELNTTMGDDEWSDEPATEKGTSWWLYLIMIIPGVFILAITYWLYKRLERKSKSADEDDDVILGSDEFSGLDDPQALVQDDELNVDDFDDEFDLDDIPVVDDAVTNEPPTLTSTEAPSAQASDMIEPDAKAIDDDPAAESEEELFDISSIDDDLSDLDLSLDGNDPFEMDEKK